MKKLTTIEFIKKATIMHGKKYNYSNVAYINSNKKVCIICTEHGNFLQTPHNHMAGQGCPTCGGTGRLTIESFIKKAKNVHGNKYDYSGVVYRNNITRVEISCPIHGKFLQKPMIHLGGCGCMQCGIQTVHKLISSNTSEFIEKASNVHNNKYDYSKVQYISALKKVYIICNLHGEFLQRPNDHLNGSGCPKCKFEKLISITVSKKEMEFLDYLTIPLESRQKYINAYVVDGLNNQTNTIYEFLGDFWHGNPQKFNPKKN